MFYVHVKSAKFENMSLVKRHQMINKVLEEDIKGFHGIQIKAEV